MCGERVPGGEGRYGEGSVAQGLMLGPECWRQEVEVRGLEEGSVVVKQVGDVGGDLVREGFVSE